MHNNDNIASSLQVYLIVPGMFIFFNLIIVGMAFYDRPVEAVLGIVTTVIGIPFYLFSRRKNRSNRIQLYMGKLDLSSL